MTHRLTTNYAKNYCNRTFIVKVIVENVVTCFLGGHGVHWYGPIVIYTFIKYKFFYYIVYPHFNFVWLMFVQMCVLYSHLQFLSFYL